MSAITLESVLRQARRLPLADQARLTSILERERAERLIHVLDEWADDESGYEEETWQELKAALDHERDQLGMQRLFDG
jgi:hypothetical protein